MNEFELDGVTYVATDTTKPTSCEGCAFEDAGKLCGRAPDCSPIDRADNKAVIFVAKP